MGTPSMTAEGREGGLAVGERASHHKNRRTHLCYMVLKDCWLVHLFRQKGQSTCLKAENVKGETRERGTDVREFAVDKDVEKGLVRSEYENVA